jgi:hypothetical protein
MENTPMPANARILALLISSSPFLKGPEAVKAAGDTRLGLSGSQGCVFEPEDAKSMVVDAKKIQTQQTLTDS